MKQIINAILFSIIDSVRFFAGFFFRAFFYFCGGKGCYRLNRLEAC